MDDAAGLTGGAVIGERVLDSHRKLCLEAKRKLLEIYLRGLFRDAQRGQMQLDKPGPDLTRRSTREPAPLSPMQEKLWEFETKTRLSEAKRKLLDPYLHGDCAQAFVVGQWFPRRPVDEPVPLSFSRQQVASWRQTFGGEPPVLSWPSRRGGSMKHGGTASSVEGSRGESRFRGFNRE
jgi:hypothetical protein